MTTIMKKGSMVAERSQVCRWPKSFLTHSREYAPWQTTTTTMETTSSPAKSPVSIIPDQAPFSYSFAASLLSCSAALVKSLSTTASSAPPSASRRKRSLFFSSSGCSGPSTSTPSDPSSSSSASRTKTSRASLRD